MLFYKNIAHRHRLIKTKNQSIEQLTNISCVVKTVESLSRYTATDMSTITKNGEFRNIIS